MTTFLIFVVVHIIIMFLLKKKSIIKNRNTFLLANLIIFIIYTVFTYMLSDITLETLYD